MVCRMCDLMLPKAGGAHRCDVPLRPRSPLRSPCGSPHVSPRVVRQGGPQSARPRGADCGYEIRRGQNAIVPRASECRESSSVIGNKADSKLLPCAGAAAPLSALINADASGVPAPIAEVVDTLLIEMPPTFNFARLKQCEVSAVVTRE